MSSDRGQLDGKTPPEEDLLVLLGRLTTAAVLAGLAAPDAEDLAQDILTWLVSSNNLEMALVAPWLAAVLQNFLRRFLRHRWRETRVTAIAIRGTGWERPASAEATDAKLFLERLAARSPLLERRLIALMARGLRLSEAARQLGIRHGSEQHYLGQIRARARRLNRLRSATVR